MQIKRFEAKDVQGALRQVKEVLGDEAIILSTRKIKRPSPGPGSIDGGRVEVIAATDQPANPPAFSPVQFAAVDRRKEGPKKQERPG